MWLLRNARSSRARGEVLVASVFGALLALAAPASLPVSAHGLRAQSTLPPGSTVQLFPLYPAASDANTPNGVASVGQNADFRLDIKPPDASWASSPNTVDVYLVEVHHEGATCQQSAPAIHIYSGQSASGGLYASGSFFWPAAATSTAYGSGSGSPSYYALCTHVTVEPQFTPPPHYFTGDASDINTTGNIFKVISDHAPTVTLSANSVAQGQTLTITGHYWIPVYSDVSDTIVGRLSTSIRPSINASTTRTSSHRWTPAATLAYLSRSHPPTHRAHTMPALAP